METNGEVLIGYFLEILQWVSIMGLAWMIRRREVIDHD